MGNSSDIKYFYRWGFKNRSAFEKYIREVTEDLEFEAPPIFRLIRKKVADWERDYLKTVRQRVVAEMFKPPKNKLVKSPERIAQKIIDSWKEHDKWKAKGGRGTAPQTCDPNKFLTTMTDVVRFRIVCNYLSDVEYIDKQLSDWINNTDDLQLKSRNDHIETPFPKRRAGHRAVQYVLKYRKTDPPILFEVQIMTLLQHAWDKKDHHLIYEYVRIGKDEKIPLHLKNRMAAMSEMLYVADTAFDALRENIMEIMEKPQK